jgi:hypothetical protein
LDIVVYREKMDDRKGEEKEAILGLVKIYKTGIAESLVVTIPKEAARLLRLLPGDRLLVKTDGARLVFEKTRP